MSVRSNSTDRQSEDVTNASNINVDEIVADELDSLLDAPNLELTRSVVVSDEFVGDDEDIYERDTDGSGVELHCAARVDGKHKHPLGATVTEGDTHESPQFDHLEDNVEVIWTFDRV